MQLNHVRLGSGKRLLLVPGLDAVADFIDEQGLPGIDLVGSSMGARMVLGLARRGVGGTAVALDPGGFWGSGQQRVFGISLRTSIKLIRALQPVLPLLTGNPVTRTLLPPSSLPARGPCPRSSPCGSCEAMPPRRHSILRWTH